MLSKNTDYMNNLLNRLAYVDIKDNWKPGDNLIDVVEKSGDKELANLLKDAGFSNYVIKDYENQNSTNGFVAIAFENPSTGEVGMSFRGTENLPEIGSQIGGILSGDENAINNQIDMIDNVSTAITGDSVQAQAALKFFEKNQSVDGNNYLYGHSKGGELASEVYSEYYERIKQVHVINPQPINWASLTPEQKKAFISGKFDAIVVNGDLVWMLGGVPYNVRIIENNKTRNDFFGPHELKSAKYDPITGEAIIENSPYSDYIAQGLVGLGVMVIMSAAQAGYKITTTILDWVDCTYQFIVKKVSEMALKAYEAIKVAYSKVKDFITDIKDTVSSWINCIGKAISDWWNKNFNTGYKYATSNPYISINTTTMASYASQLRTLSSRSKTLDRKMNSLYWNLGIEWDTIANLGKLLKAEVILDFAYRLDKCANYLSDTAHDFDSVERDLQSM